MIEPAPETAPPEPLEVVRRDRLESPHGTFDVSFFRGVEQGRVAMALVLGDPAGSDPLLARVHSSCVTSEGLMALDCDCAEQLDGALAEIARVGRGVLFYLMQEGRGAGLSAKARDRMIVQASRHRLTTFDAYAEMGLPPDLRRYGDLGEMARLLGIRAPIGLLTNNPEKARAVARSLSARGLELERTVPLQGPASPFNRDYLRAKRSSGHAIDRGAGQTVALPPEPVEVESPRRARNAPALLSTASYLLPVGLDPAPAGTAVDWLRLRVIRDLRTARESVVLSLGRAPEGSGESCTLSLVDRLPCAEATGRESLRAAMRALRARGEGALVVHFDESCARGPAPFGEPALDREMLSACWEPAHDTGARDAGR